MHNPLLIPAVEDRRADQYEHFIRQHVQVPAEPERLDSIPGDVPLPPKGHREVIVPGQYMDGHGTIDWGTGIDQVITGNFTPVVGSTIAVALTAAAPLIIRPPNHYNGALGQLIVRQFTLATRTLVGSGAITVVYQSPSGDQIALGCVNLGVGQIMLPDVCLLSKHVLFSAPQTNFGTLAVSLSAGGVAAVCEYAIGFGVAYLRPTSKAVEVEE